MLSRRKFIRGLSAGFALTLVRPADIFAFQQKKIIGIQLYTLKEQVKEDLPGTLDRIAEIGYNATEAAGYSKGKFYGLSPGEYKKLNTGRGLIPQSSHTMFTPDNANEVIDNTLEAGMSYLVIPYLGAERRRSLDDYRRLADEFNEMGSKCNGAGLTFAYHNHAFEFEKMEEEVPYDILLERTEPDLVTMQLDLYWMVYGGYDPVDYFNRYPGRFKLWHVKDMDDTEKRESTEIGNGIIDFEKIFRMKEMAGMEYYYLEQESFKMPPFESIEISFNYLDNLKY